MTQIDQSLTHLNPHAVLDRGYALVQTVEGAIVRDSAELQLEQGLQISFAKGKANAKVTAVEKA